MILLLFPLEKHKQILKKYVQADLNLNINKAFFNDCDIGSVKGLILSQVKNLVYPFSPNLCEHIWEQGKYIFFWEKNIQNFGVNLQMSSFTIFYLCSDKIVESLQCTFKAVLDQEYASLTNANFTVYKYNGLNGS